MNIFEKIGLFFKTKINKFFTKTLDEIKDHEKWLHDAATITYKIYSYTESPEAQALEAILPENANLFIKEVVQSNLKLIAANFSAFDEDVKNASDINDLIKRMSDTMKKLEPTQFAFVAHNVSSFLAHTLSPTTTLGKIFAVIESVWQAFTKHEVIP